MIYKRGNVWWIKYYRNGKPLRESTKSKKEADAKRLLKKREGEISNGKLPGIYLDRIRFDELVENFLTDYRINGKDIVRAELRVRHLNETFAGMKVVSIDTPQINLYIEKRRSEGAANATINRELAALKRILNLGANQTPPRVDRVPHILMLKEDNVRKGFFEHHEFEALRAVLPDHLKGVLAFGYKTGWRVSEITDLTWDHIDLQQGIVRLEAGETKNTEGRTVYLDDGLKEVMSNQFINRHLGCPYIFHRDGQQIKSFRKVWKSACQKAGIKDKLFHDLRRTAVRNMVRAGIPEKVAMMISGHKTRSVFDRYNIVSSDDLKQAAAKQEAYLKTLSE